MDIWMKKKVCGRAWNRDRISPPATIGVPYQRSTTSASRLDTVSCVTKPVTRRFRAP